MGRNVEGYAAGIFWPIRARGLGATSRAVDQCQPWRPAVFPRGTREGTHRPTIGQARRLAFLRNRARRVARRLLCLVMVGGADLGTVWPTRAGLELPPWAPPGRGFGLGLGVGLQAVELGRDRG
jgi:hypothetical protein